jgi:hypothetical protein
MWMAGMSGKKTRFALLSAMTQENFDRCQI